MSGFLRFVMVAVLVATMGGVVDTSAVGAVAPPPAFILKWGAPGVGNGQFIDARSVAINPTTDTVYVTDVDSAVDRVQAFAADGTYLDQWGGHGSGDGQFNGAYGVAVNPTDGTVYVTDVRNYRVQAFTADGTYLDQWGSYGTGDGQFRLPYGIAVDAATGAVYIADVNNHNVQAFTAEGDHLASWGSQGSGEGQFGSPHSVAVDPTDGTVYVADYDNDRVQAFTADGTYLDQWGTYGPGQDELDRPSSIAVDPGTGTVHLVDYSERVKAFTADGTHLTTWGSYGTGDGQFNGPAGLAVDSDNGDLYVVDGGNTRVQRFGSPPDITDPTVTLTTPPDGAVYARGQVVNAAYICTDDTGGSGIATCTASPDVAPGAPIDTSTLGDHTFAVTATDNADNTSTVTHTYTVGDPRPDGRIKKSPGTYKGDGVYNTTGVGQTARGTARRGGTVTFVVSMQNDASFPEALSVRGTASTPRFRITYTVDGTGVTTAMTSGAFTTPVLDPGATFKVKVAVTVRTTAPMGSSLTGTVTVKSATTPAVRDTVRFVTTRTA